MASQSPESAEQPTPPLAALAELSTLSVAGHALRLVFEQHADRVAHRVELTSEDGSLVLLESIEGNDQQAWPASPALQSLHVEEREHGPMALLVGMSGTSHWSASAAAEPDSPALLLDVACRVKQPPAQLQSAYRLASTANTEQQANRISLALAEGLRVTVESVSLAETPVAASTAGQAKLDAATGEIALSPTLLPELTLPQTVRWRYRIELSAKPTA